MKLNSIQVKEICKRYVQTEVSMEDLAREYNCSPSTLSNAICRAIYYSEVDEETAEKIKRKSAGNVDIKLQELGYHKSHKVERKYDWVIGLARLRKLLVEKNQNLEFDIELYEATYSEADDYPYTKEALEDTKEKLEKELKELDKTFRKGRR